MFSGAPPYAGQSCFSSLELRELELPAAWGAPVRIRGCPEKTTPPIARLKKILAAISENTLIVQLRSPRAGPPTREPSRDGVSYSGKIRTPSKSRVLNPRGNAP